MSSTRRATSLITSSTTPLATSSPRRNAANGDRFKFAGMQFDATTGQYYDHARWYGAGIGRFLGLDPTSFSSGDQNLYRYLHDGPVNGVDTTGFSASLDSGQLAALSGAGTLMATGVGMTLMQGTATAQLAMAGISGSQMALGVAGMAAAVSGTAAAATAAIVAAAPVLAMGVIAIEGVALAAEVFSLAYSGYAYTMATIAGGMLDAQIQQARMRQFLAVEAVRMNQLNAMGLGVYNSTMANDGVDDNLTLRMWSLKTS